MKLKILIFIILVFANCGQPRWSSLPVCADMTEDEEFEAALLINQAVGEEVIIECEGQISFEYVDDLYKDNLLMNGTTEINYKQGLIGSAHIKIHKGLSGKVLKHTIIHEMGHALGHIQHAEEGIMLEYIPYKKTEYLIPPLTDWILTEYFYGDQ